MKFNKEELRNLFFYGGISKEDFYAIEEQRSKDNFKTFRTVSSVGIVYFLALFISTFVSNAVTANRKVDLILLIVSVLVFIILKSPEKINIKLGETAVYILICSMFAFSIIIGGILSKDYLAVTFPALLIAVPLFTLDRPYRLNNVSIVATAIFIITCVINKTGLTRSMDIYNAICFYILSFFIALYSVKTKMKSALLMYRVEGLSLLDELTGFYNRRSFEESCKEIGRGVIPENLLVVSMDANGLKDVNDKLGHEAGDELICAAADCMKSCFGGYGKLFRTGGDEFMGLLNIELERFELIFKNFEASTSRFEGHYIKGLSVSCGHCSKSEYDNISIEDMCKVSDKRMYEAKALYYSRKGVDRRGQQDAFNALCASYVKILRVNLTEDSYQVVSVRPEMEIAERNYNKESISQYLRDVALAGNIHPDDLDEFTTRTKLDYMRQFFVENDKPLNIFYKRKIEGTKPSASLDMNLRQCVG